MKKQLLALVAGVVLVSGCRMIDTPKGFALNADPEPYYFQALSADNVKIRLRIEDSKDAPQEFWKKAVVNEMTKQRGYKKVGEEPIETDSGLQGDLLTFQYESFGKKFTYLAAVFTRDDHVAIVEAGGEEKMVKQEKKSLLEAIRSLRHRWLFIIPRW